MGSKQKSTDFKFCAALIKFCAALINHALDGAASWSTLFANGLDHGPANVAEGAGPTDILPHNLETCRPHGPGHFLRKSENTRWDRHIKYKMGSKQQSTADSIGGNTNVSWERVSSGARKIRLTQMRLRVWDFYVWTTQRVCPPLGKPTNGV